MTKILKITLKYIIPILTIWGISSHLLNNNPYKGVFDLKNKEQLLFVEFAADQHYKLCLQAFKFHTDYSHSTVYEYIHDLFVYRDTEILMSDAVWISFFQKEKLIRTYRLNSNRLYSPGNPGMAYLEARPSFTSQSLPTRSSRCVIVDNEFDFNILQSN